jgi:hypothetical protein
MIMLVNDLLAASAAFVLPERGEPERVAVDAAPDDFAAVAEALDQAGFLVALAAPRGFGLAGDGSGSEPGGAVAGEVSGLAAFEAPAKFHDRPLARAYRYRANNL